MKRRLLILALGLGTVGGFASGFASLACHHRERRAAFEHHVAAVCVEAAREVEDDRSGGCDARYEEPYDAPPPRRHHGHGRHHRPHWRGYGY